MQPTSLAYALFRDNNGLDAYLGMGPSLEAIRSKVLSDFHDVDPKGEVITAREACALDTIDFPLNLRVALDGKNPQIVILSHRAPCA